MSLPRGLHEPVVEIHEDLPIYFLKIDENLELNEYSITFIIDKPQHVS